MGVKLIARGVGRKIYFFSYSQFLRAPNPFMPPVKKAMNPHTPLGMLEILAKSIHLDAKYKAIENISNRLKGPLNKSAINRIFKMHPVTVCEVLSRDIYLDKEIQMPIILFLGEAAKHKEIPPCIYRKALIKLTSHPEDADSEIAKISFYDLDKDITSDELERIAMVGPTPYIANLMVYEKKSPEEKTDEFAKKISGMMTRNALLNLGLVDYGAESKVSSNVYSKLEKLSRDELEFLSHSKSKRILESIYVNGRSSPQAIANAVLNLTVKIKDEYEEKFFRQACSYIKGRPSEKDEILSYISKKDSKLRKAIDERLEKTKHIPSPIEFGPSSDL